jgi:hypothetical protein
MSSACLYIRNYKYGHKGRYCSKYHACQLFNFICFITVLLSVTFTTFSSVLDVSFEGHDG